MASYCGSPRKLHTATNNFLSHFTQNPNTSPWPSGHLGPACKRPLQPSPFSRPACLALLAWLLRLGPHVTSPEACFPRPWHLQHITTRNLIFLPGTYWPLRLYISFSTPAFPLASVLRGWAPYLYSLLVPRTGLPWLVHSLDKKQYSHTHSFPTLSLSHPPTPTHPMCQETASEGNPISKIIF